MGLEASPALSFYIHCPACLFSLPFALPFLPCLFRPAFSTLPFPSYLFCPCFFRPAISLLPFPPCVFRPAFSALPFLHCLFCPAFSVLPFIPFELSWVALFFFIHCPGCFSLPFYYTFRTAFSALPFQPCLFSPAFSALPFPSCLFHPAIHGGGS